MKKLILQVAINSVSFYVVSLVLAQVRLNGYYTAIMAGTVLTILNISVRPLLMLVAFPFNLLTFGLLTLVVNTLMVMLTESAVPGLNIQGFWMSFLTAVLISLINLPFHRFYRNRPVSAG